MMIKLISEEKVMGYYDATKVEPNADDGEITVEFANGDEETYDYLDVTVFISTPQGWEEVK